MSTFLTWQLADQLSVWGLNVLLQVTFITALSLFVAGLLRRRPAVRHGALCGALFLLFAAPVTALIMQVSGRGLLVLPLSNDSSPSSADTVIAGHPLLPGLSAPGLPQSFSGASPLSDVPSMSNHDSPGRDQPDDRVSEATDASRLADDIRPNEARLPLASSQAQTAATTPSPVGQLPAFVRQYVPLFLSVWFVGSALLLYRTAVRWIRLRAVLRASRPVTCDHIKAALAEDCRFLGVERPPPLMQSSRISTPLAAGLLRPRVVLPEAIAAGVNSDQLRQVLVHELAHVVRRDPAVALVQNIVGAMFWLHPLVYVVNRQLARAREEVCDNFVLRAAAAPAYSRTLLLVAELTAGIRPLPQAVGLLTSRWRLEMRIAGILDDRRNLTARLTRGAKTLLAALLLLTASIAASVTISETAAPAGVAAGDDRPSQNPASATAKQTKGTARTDEATEPLPAGALFRLGSGRFRHEGWDKNVGYAADGKVLVSCSGQSLKFWDAGKGTLLRQVSLEDTIHRVMRVFPDGKRVATLGARLGKVRSPREPWWLRVWDVATGALTSEILHTPDPQAGDMRTMAISPDGTLVFLGDFTGSIYIYELATGLKLLQYRVADLQEVKGLALSPDGQRLAITTGSDQIYLWDWSSGEDLVLLREGHRYLGVAFSPDGKLLAFAEDRSYVQLWDVEAHKLLHSLEDAPQAPLYVEELAFTPDGTKLAAATL